MTTPLKALVLLGIAHLSMASSSCDIDSYFKVEIDISSPTNVEFDLTSCDSNKAKADLHELIQRQVDKRFDEYFAATKALRSMEVEEICGGSEEGGANRALTFQTRNNAWYYSSKAKCRFCLPDKSDRLGGGADFGDAERDNAERVLQNTLQRQLSRGLTRKVNKSEKMSCLVGSDSEVDVTITPTGSHHPQVVCPP